MGSVIIDIEEGTEVVYQEELALIKTLQIYIAENHEHPMIGCIRVMK